MLKALRLSVLATVAFTAVLPAFASDDSFGSGVPLEMAVRKLAPQGVAVEMADGVDGMAAASWGGDGSWKKSVVSAAKSAGYVAVVTDQSVTITAPGAVVSTKTTTKVVAAKPESDPLPIEPLPVDAKPAPTFVPPPVVAVAEPPAKVAVAEPPAKVVVSPKADAPRRAEQRRAERRVERKVEPRRPAVRDDRRRERKESRVVQETVSGGGFVFIPQETKAPRVASVDAKGEASGWRRYDKPHSDKGSRPRPVVAAPVAPAVPAAWAVAAGDDLHSVLSDWSARSGWKLVWQSDHIYSLSGAAAFQGNFVDVVTQLLAAMRDVRPVVTAQFYEANNTLVIGNDLSDSVN